MRPGDTLFLARRRDDQLFFIVTPEGSTIESQLLWLFGLNEQPGLQFEQREVTPDNDAELDFAARYILDELGIDAEEPEADRLDGLIVRFGRSEERRCGKECVSPCKSRWLPYH